MNKSVASFVKDLDHVQTTKNKLRVIVVRIEVLKSYFLFGSDKERRAEYRETLQQYLDIFAHLYDNNTLSNFVGGYQNIKLIGNVN